MVSGQHFFRRQIASFFTRPLLERYPVFIDVCAQSFGKGFVGTARSTLSLVSAKRVVDWNDGVYRRVGWGHKGDDDNYDGH